MRIIIVAENEDLGERIKAKLAHIGLVGHEIAIISKLEIPQHGAELLHISLDEGRDILEILKSRNIHIPIERNKEILSPPEYINLVGFNNVNHRGKDRTHKNKYYKK